MYGFLLYSDNLTNVKTIKNPLTGTLYVKVTQDACSFIYSLSQISSGGVILLSSPNFEH